jgi:hypoxanthine phosphoribosyltransferase
LGNQDAGVFYMVDPNDEYPEEERWGWMVYRDGFNEDAIDFIGSYGVENGNLAKAIKEMFTAYVESLIDDVFTGISEEEEVTEL